MSRRTDAIAPPVPSQVWPGNPVLSQIQGSQSLRDIAPKKLPLTPPAHESPHRTPSSLIRKSQKSRGTTIEHPVLACPFYKKDPKLHHDCSRYKLSRVKDVIQHLQRKHVQDVNGESTSGFISPGRLQELLRLKQQKLGHKVSMEDQWLGIWTVIFPDVRRPSSIFLEGHVTEVLAQLQHFWTINRVVLSAEMIHQVKAWDKDVQDGSALDALDRFVDGLLRGFAAGVASEPSSPTEQGCLPVFVESPPQSAEDVIANSGPLEPEDSGITFSGVSDTSPFGVDPFFGFQHDDEFQDFMY